MGVRFNTEEEDNRFRFYGESCSIFECQELCQDTPQCHYFSYRADGAMNGSCILYNSTGLVRDDSKPNHISGPRSCEGRTKQQFSQINANHVKCIRKQGNYFRMLPNWLRI